MIKEKVEEVGVHFSTRRSKRDKYLFVNRLAGKLQEAGRTLRSSRRTRKVVKDAIWYPARSEEDGSLQQLMIQGLRC